MSAENVELVRLLYDAVARHDFETVTARYADDVEWDFSRSPVRAIIGRDRYEGHAGLRVWWQEWSDVWATYEDRCDDIIDAGECVITDTRSRGRGRASGAELEWRQYGVWTVKDGKVTRVVWLSDLADAHREAGLTPA